MSSIERLRAVPDGDHLAKKNGQTLRDEANKKALAKFLDQRGLKSTAANAFGWWPTLEETALALSAHLGDLKDESGQSLAFVTIERALLAFREATQAGPIDAGVAAFLAAVLSLAEYLLRLSIYVEDAAGLQLVWRQFGEPYPAWLARHKAFGPIHSTQASFVFPEDLWAAKRMLATATMGPRDFNLAFRAEHP
jgi:hypothetical protein